MKWRYFTHYNSLSGRTKKRPWSKQTRTDLILCSLERSGLRLVNFWASLQTVTMKKKTLTMMTKHTGPKKLQMRPSSRDSQQLVRGKETHVHDRVWPYVTEIDNSRSV